MRALRASLVIAFGLMLAVMAFTEAWTSYQSGVVSIPLGRRRSGVVLTFDRLDQPTYYYLALLTFVLLGAVFMAAVAWQTRGLITRSRAEREVATQAILGPLEQAAPSGLAPLGWGLLVVAACILVYAAA